MEPSKEPVRARIARMNNMFLGRTAGQMKNCLGREGLLDALVVLYDECNSESLKKDPCVSAFVDKFRAQVADVRRLRVNITDFEIKNVIGRGLFGEVHVVKEKQTGDIYAMKTLRKADAINQRSAAFYEEEREIMLRASSPWLISLQYAFQDMHNLYLVMEFQPGGDLRSLLDRFGGSLGEDMAKFYIAELALAIHTLHGMGYVHRDIKPENVLLDRCGHVKLADFGSSAKLTGAGTVTGQLTSPVGTPDYISPEVLDAMEKQDGASSSAPPAYGVECDFWSLGVIAYEMVIGSTPFREEKLAATYRNIQTYKKSLQYPADAVVSDCLKNVISGLLNSASGRFGYSDLTKHPFFVDMDWTGLLDIVPPFVPIVNGEDDTSNFIEYERSAPQPSIEHFKAKKDFSGRNLPFVGFTYAKDIAGGYLDKSLQQNSVVEHLETSLNAKRKEVHELVAKIHMLENGDAPWRNREETERRVEELSKRLELVEEERSRLEGELARAKSEQQSLRRALALERQEARNMETRAMELIKCAKEKWDKEREEKAKHVERLTDTVTNLNTTNNELSSKLHRRTKELQDLQAEMSELQKVVTGVKDKMAKTRQSRRDSLIAVENRISQMATENESQRVNLQDSLHTECEKNVALEKDLREARYKISQLEEEAKMEAIRNEALRSELQEEISSLRTQLLEKDRCSSSSSDTMHSLDSESSISGCPMASFRLPTIVHGDNMSASMISFEHHEITVVQRELESQLRETQDQLQKLKEENSSLIEALNKSQDMREELEQKLSSLEELMQKLETGLSHLEDENSQLRDQNMKLSRAVQHKNRSSVAPNTAVVSPRASTTTTITTTVVASAAATPSRPALENKAAQDDAASAKMELQVLTATIERLEAQLEKAKEASLVDRQAAQTAQTTLWKKEKELSNAKLDQRIAEREARMANETIKKLEEEKKQLEAAVEAARQEENEKNKADREKLEKVNHDLLQLKVELRREKNAAVSLNDDLQKERDALAAANEKLAEAEKREAAIKAELSSTKKELKLHQAQLVSSQDEVKRLDIVCQELRTEKRRLLQQLEATQQEMEGLQLSNKQLKDLCSVLDEQLEDFEKLTSTYSEKEAKLAQEIVRLQAEVEASQAATKSAKQALNDEKSLKLRAEARLPALEAQLDARIEELAQVNKQRNEYKSLAEQLTAQVNDLEEQTSQQEVALHTCQRQIANLQADILSLKEEATAHLTRIQSLKETNLRLDQELAASTSEGRTLTERLETLQSTMAELEECHAHKELKSAATLKQQSKLISYLQSKLEEQGRRKKTFTDKLFGRKDKENTTNNIPNMALKDLEGQLVMERNKVNKLEQIIRARSPPPAKDKEKEKEKGRETTPPNQILSPKTAKQLILSPGTQTSPDSLRRQPSAQRMHHNIPHRFEMKLVMKASKCAVCQEALQFGRQAYVCQECGITSHFKCSSALPSTCGLPSAFARHFSMSMRKKSQSAIHQESPVPVGTSNMEGWLKLPKRGRSCWERRYVKLVGSELLIFDHEPTNPNLSPVERLNLCTPKGAATVTGDVTQAEMASTAKSDLPFIIKLEVASATTCWPSSTQYLMVLNASDKDKWIEALKQSVRTGRDDGGSGEDSEIDGGNGSRRYSGQVAVPVYPDTPLEVNCVVHMGTELVLLGTDKGLFSYRLNEEKCRPVKVTGVSSVHQLLPVPHLKVAVMIAERNLELFKCDLRTLQSCAAAAECSQANVAIDPVLSNSTADVQDRCFQIIAAAKSGNFSGTSDLLCAATADRFYIFKWTSSGKNGSNFSLVKSLKTQEPCATILLRPHSIIVGCNKFFEIDAQDYTVEDFMDSSDPIVGQSGGSVKKSGFPVAALDVTSQGGPCSPEYLLCFHEMGIFVDGYGQRSRDDAILWSRVPFTVGFREPFLFVVHFASVEVILVTGTSFVRNLNDSGSTAASSASIPPSKFIALNSPKLLGNAHASDCVYVSNSTAKGAEVVCVSGNAAFKDRTEEQLRCGGAHNEEDSEFSFTSSIVQSLDDQRSQIESDDGSISHRDSDSTCDTDAAQTDRRVHFTARTPHTAM